MSSNNNTMILAGLGLAALWVMSRQRGTVGAVRPVTGGGGLAAANNSTGQQLGSLLAGFVNGLRPSSTSKPASPASAGYNPSPAQAAAAQAAAQRDEDPDLNGSVSDYASSQVDGVAYNPPNSSVYDAMNFYEGGA